MNLEFTEEQDALRKVVRELFADLCPPERLRDDAELDAGAWEKLAGVGLLGLGVPESAGGTGTDPGDLLVVLEEAGRAGLSVLTVAELFPGGSDALRDQAAYASAAVLCGVATRLLEMSVAHARAREQFGQPIGAFQAVKHQLAEVHTALESARGATRLAACALWNATEDQTLAAAAAHAEAVAAAALANRVALQVHGGIGFTREHDLRLWLERGMALEHAYGSVREEHELLAAALLDAPLLDHGAHAS